MYFLFTPCCLYRQPSLRPILYPAPFRPDCVLIPLLRFCNVVSMESPPHSCPILVEFILPGHPMVAHCPLGQNFILLPIWPRPRPMLAFPLLYGPRFHSMAAPSLLHMHPMAIPCSRHSHSLIIPFLPGPRPVENYFLFHALLGPRPTFFSRPPCAIRAMVTPHSPRQISS